MSVFVCLPKKIVVSGSEINVPVEVQNSDLIRYGRVYSSILWSYGNEISAPAAGATLISYTLPADKQGYIHGLYIYASEANVYKLTWTSGGATKSIRISVGDGSLQIVYGIAINEGLPADAGTTISISVVKAGASGSVYQTGILVGIV